MLASDDVIVLHLNREERNCLLNYTSMFLQDHERHDGALIELRYARCLRNALLMTDARGPYEAFQVTSQEKKISDNVRGIAY